MITASPINKKKVESQNDKLLALLQNRESITLFDGFKIGILHCHSRISDLRNKNGIVIYDRMASIRDFEGNIVNVKEYSLKPF